MREVPGTRHRCRTAHDAAAAAYDMEETNDECAVEPRPIHRWPLLRQVADPERCGAGQSLRPRRGASLHGCACPCPNLQGAPSRQPAHIRLAAPGTASLPPRRIKSKALRTWHMRGPAAVANATYTDRPYVATQSRSTRSGSTHVFADSGYFAGVLAVPPQWATRWPNCTRNRRTASWPNVLSPCDQSPVQARNSRTGLCCCEPFQVALQFVEHKVHHVAFAWANAYA